MNSILLNMINVEATSTYAGPIPTAANYKNWVDHWFKAAERIAADFNCEGLPETAKAVKDIIAQEKKYLGDKYG